MKKKVRKLSLKKTVISSFQSKGIVGGTDSFRRRCEPIDLSLLETCTPECDLTVTCTQFNTCNDITFNNCTVYNCTGGGTGNTGGTTGGNSGGISCPGFEC